MSKYSALNLEIFELCISDLFSYVIMYVQCNIGRVQGWLTDGERASGSILGCPATRIRRGMPERAKYILSPKFENIFAQTFTSELITIPRYTV
jgi:hypothetical protein